MYVSLSHRHTQRGFTLIELLVVIAIIGILASVTFMAIEQSRVKARDNARKTQFQEILKALELHYSDTGSYPVDGTPGDDTTGAQFSTIGSGFVGGQFFSRLPDESARYYYCSTSDGTSMTISLDTELDGTGGSNYCSLTRGSGPAFGCGVWVATNAADSCATRF